MLNEFSRVAFRKKRYRTLKELQAELDAWLRDYNETRPHQGRWWYGKTPEQTFMAQPAIADSDYWQTACPWRRRNCGGSREPERTLQRHRVLLRLSARGLTLTGKDLGKRRRGYI